MCQKKIQGVKNFKLYDCNSNNVVLAVLCKKKREKNNSSAFQARVRQTSQITVIEQSKRNNTFHRKEKEEYH